MADRRSSGLSFGQLITLTFGFLLASVVIFVFGIWVGRDLADQQASRQRDVARLPITAPDPEPPKPTPYVRSTPTAVAPAIVFVPTSTPASASTATLVIVVHGSTQTPARAAGVTPTAGAGGYTVQAYATNDMMKAVMLSRTLQSSGYPASTATRQIGGVTWYLVRVGRYRDRAAAKAVESKLRSEEGLEAASVTAQ